MSGLNPIAIKLASSHAARVAADNGVIDDFNLLKLTLDQLVKIYGATSEANLKTKLPVTLSPKIFGYKAGTGAGITAGQAVTKIYSIDSANDITQATAANQPLLLRHTGTNYYWASRVSGNSITGTHSMTYNAASDTLVITAKIFLNNQNAGGTVDYVVALGTAAILGISNAGTSKFLRFRGTTNALDSASYTPSTTDPHWVRVTSNSAMQVIYEWSANGTSWTNIGTQVRPTIGSIGSCVIGSTAAATTNVCSVYSASVQNVTTGFTVTFDPNKYNRKYNQTGWNHGNATWTIVTGSAATGYKGILVDETYVIGNGVDQKLALASLSLAQPFTSYIIMRRLGTGTLLGFAAAASLANNGTNLTLDNGAALSVANSGRLRQLATIVSNSATSSLQIDNAAATTGNAGTNAPGYLELLGNASSYGNHILESVIISNAVDSSTVRSRMYQIHDLDNALQLSLTGDSIQSRLYTGGLENLVRNAVNFFFYNHAVPGSNLGNRVANDPLVWNPYSFVERSKIGAANIIDVTNIDIMAVWAGFNDWSTNVPLGAINSNDDYTVAGAIRNGVANYLARKPKLKILFINASANPNATSNSLGLALSDYAAWTKTVCESIGILCYDMHANCGINAGNYAAILTDNVHPIDSYMNDPLALLVATFLNTH